MTVPGVPGAPVAGRRLAWPGVLALVLVMLLIVGLGIQSWLLYGVSTELDRANEQLDQLNQGQTEDGGRLGALEDRADALEDFAGDVFNPQEVANAVLPSVLMVVAGDFSGTAFAVGEASSGGGTNLFTNYHVVQQVWEGGGRDVELQRTDQTFPARIVDVAPEADVAWLETESGFDGLATSTDVTSGQQVVVVGAPQGLNDTVTAGVVSTPERTLDDGSGPWIQFDAAVNPGNSGGPVIDADQAVIGIASAKDPESEAIGYAVPIEVACGLFDIC
jgi:putative serine protease PepD